MDHAVRPIQAVLFTCGYNAIRSPMAEAIARHYFGKSIYVQSAGVNKGDVDPFTLAVLDEIGIDAHKHKPRTIDELDDWEGLNFDLIITLSPEAHHKMLDLTQVLDAYREVRDILLRQIQARLKSN